MAYVLIFAAYLYHLFTGDSVEWERTRDATRKLPRTRTSSRAPSGASAAHSSRGTQSTRPCNRGRSQVRSHGRAAPVEENEEEEEQETVPTENMKTMSRKNWKLVRE